MRCIWQNNSAEWASDISFHKNETLLLFIKAPSIVTVPPRIPSIHVGPIVATLFQLAVLKVVFSYALGCLSKAERTLQAMQSFSQHIE